ncbi:MULTISPECIES: DUF4354 family protein [Erwinia]|uniref:DUF4354 family protein n=1 Tax=Erwinia rhapontici TaxID=55212 RepID=A0ABM7N5C1_ERWRD|nr:MULTISPECIES: DUF4354 family protein [Erwinia]MBP2152732.1 hypothetical protein [Erwinia rhapontici]MCS3608073.1 hypothetical protein [Erwinia rhapontici]NNS08001.1 DUF4354 family protein [Erwinia sp. JH02]BCQ36611.1 hypothetical protein ERHA53_39540 [Erwinia rhapontici]BCQ41609.1 hypothetical protein ERHA54_42120 [Erwinia rhapontici]
MKRSFIIITMTTVGLCFSAAAVAADQSGIAVYSTQKELKSLSSDGLDNYGKTFNVTLKNTTAKNIDLQMFCLKGYSRDGREFPVDRVDEHLARGKLKPQGKVTGPVIFSAADDSVFDINRVKITDKCR